MNRTNLARFLAALCLAAFSTPHALAQTSSQKGVTVTESGDIVRVEINGKLFTEYNYQKVSRPFLYPVLGPGGLPLTRNWPMKEGENEAKDHPHHRSLWYAHGDINGVDFWSESSRAGKTVHKKFVELKSGPDAAVIKTENELVSSDGKVIGTDTRTMRFSGGDSERFIDFDVAIHASHGELVLGDTKEGSMAIRVAPTLRVKGEVGQGHIVTSEGVRDGATWGKRAKWCDYYGPVQGQMVGIAIFDHPRNPRHPTWWHVRDYGLFGANPFGIHDFERKPAGAGNMTVSAGETVLFRYRFFFHRGNEKEADVEGAYQKFAAQVP